MRKIMKEKKIAFIINPISGSINKNKVEQLICELIDPDKFIFTITYTQYPGHAIELSQQYATIGYYAVVAVGGDGTINEVAKGLLGSKTALGIIPCGSGNGFAKCLKISTNLKQTIRLLNNARVISIDYGMANNIPFFSILGIGFDAVVAKEFSSTNRGLMGYLQTICKVFVRYRPERYQIVGDTIDLSVNAFLIDISNSGQWGNNAYVASKATLYDGWLDLVVVERIPIYNVLGFALSLFTKNIDKMSNVKTFRVKNVTLRCENDIVAHLDGDSIFMGKMINVRIVEKGLNVLVNTEYY